MTAFSEIISYIMEKKEKWYCGWILLSGCCFVKAASCGGAFCIIKPMPSGYAYTYSSSWKTQSFGSFGRRSQNIKKGLSNSLESPCLVWFLITRCSQTRTALPRTALLRTALPETAAGSGQTGEHTSGGDVSSFSWTVRTYMSNPTLSESQVLFLLKQIV